MAIPGTMSATVDDRQWSMMIRRISALRRRGTDIVLRNVARDYSRTAARTTRMAKKVSFRKVTAGGKTLWVPVSPPRYPAGRGFTRLAWWKALEGLGVRMSSPNRKVTRSRQLGIYEHKATADRSVEAFIVGNKVPWIRGLDAKDRIDATGRQVAWSVLTKNIRRYESMIKEAARG